MRTPGKVLFFLVGVLYFFLLDISRTEEHSLPIISDGNMTRIEEDGVRLNIRLDGACSYRQLHNGEYHILKIINPDEGVVLIREIRLSSEIDFVVTGVPKEWLVAKIIKLAWV